jgi:hypothetical protein
MNNEPVAWMSPEGWAYGKHEAIPPECNIPLYTHPHPDNLGLAESIIKQQQIDIENWKRKYKDMHNLATQAMSRVHELEKAQEK